MAQDYLFVTDLLVFQSRLFARVPRPDQAVLADGLVAVEAELGWFEGQAAQRGLELEASRHLTTTAYRDYLIKLQNEPYTARITTLWALERTYLEAWRNAAFGHPDYREIVRRFVGVLVKGHEYALYHREAARDALLSRPTRSWIPR